MIQLITRRRTMTTRGHDLPLCAVMSGDTIEPAAVDCCDSVRLRLRKSTGRGSESEQPRHLIFTPSHLGIGRHRRISGQYSVVVRIEDRWSSTENENGHRAVCTGCIRPHSHELVAPL